MQAPAYHPRHRNTIGLKQRATGVFILLCESSMAFLFYFIFVSLGRRSFSVSLRDRIFYSLVSFLPLSFSPFFIFSFSFTHSPIATATTLTTTPHHRLASYLLSFFPSFSPPSHPSPSLCKHHRLLALFLFTFLTLRPDPHSFFRSWQLNSSLQQHQLPRHSINKH